MPRPGRHPVDRAGLDALHGAQAVPVHHRAFEQIGDGREADVRMRPHVVVVAGTRGDRPEVVEEHERADRLPRESGQQPAHREAAAQVLVARRQQKLWTGMVAPTGRGRDRCVISVVTCVISLCTGHLPATSSSSSRCASRERTGQRQRRVQAIGALALFGIVALDGHCDVLDRDLLAVGIPQHGQRLAGGERRIVQVVRRRSGILAADRFGLVDGERCLRTATMCRILPVRSRVTEICIACSRGNLTIIFRRLCARSSFG